MSERSEETSQKTSGESQRSARTDRTDGRAATRSELRTFLVPYDFSPHAEEALRVATDLATRLGADLHLLHVVQPPFYAYGYALQGSSVAPLPIDMALVRESAMKSLDEVLAGVRSFPGKREAHVVDGAGIADRIRECAEALEADLIVMGTHGRTGIAHVFLGSVAERTLRRAPCPVLTVQAPEASEQAAADDRRGG